MGMSNPNVPGNTALTTAQTALQNAEEAMAQARNTAKQKTADRNAALTTWTTAVTNLTGFILVSGPRAHRGERVSR